MDRLLDLQVRADNLALRLQGADRDLIWEMRQEIMKRERLLQTIRLAVGPIVPF